jgi:hypothetical protein
MRESLRPRGEMCQAKIELERCANKINPHELTRVSEAQPRLDLSNLACVGSMSGDAATKGRPIEGQNA